MKDRIFFLALLEYIIFSEVLVEVESLSLHIYNRKGDFKSLCICPSMGSLRTSNGGRYPHAKELCIRVDYQLFQTI